MSYTAARVTPGGLPFTIRGAQKETITDVTVTTNSESVTASDLGLSAILQSWATVQTGQATDTGTYATAIPNSGGTATTVAEFTAAGVAATTAAATVVRVRAQGY